MTFPARISRQLEENPRLFWLLFIIWTIFTSGSGWILAIRNSPKPNCSQVSTQNCEGSSLAKQDENENNDTPICRIEDITSNEEKWDTKFYSRNSEGFWCPKKGWEDQVMWYKEGVLPAFKKISVEYEVINNQKVNTNNPPSFIFAFGSNIPIFKVWTPEGENLQLFRFAKNLNLDSDALTSEPAETLPDPVKIGRTDNLVIEQNHISGNESSINFIYNYTSAISGKGVSEPIPKKVETRISDIISSSSKIPFGIGTFAGHCIKPIKYEICEEISK